MPAPLPAQSEGNKWVEGHGNTNCATYSLGVPRQVPSPPRCCLLAFLLLPSNKAHLRSCCRDELASEFTGGES